MGLADFPAETACSAAPTVLLRRPLPLGSLPRTTTGESAVNHAAGAPCCADDGPRRPSGMAVVDVTPWRGAGPGAGLTRQTPTSIGAAPQHNSHVHPESPPRVNPSRWNHVADRTAEAPVALALAVPVPPEEERPAADSAAGHGRDRDRQCRSDAAAGAGAAANSDGAAGDAAAADGVVADAGGGAGAGGAAGRDRRRRAGLCAKAAAGGARSAGAVGAARHAAGRDGRPGPRRGAGRGAAGVAAGGRGVDRPQRHAVQGHSGTRRRGPRWRRAGAHPGADGSAGPARRTCLSSARTSG